MPIQTRCQCGKTLNVPDAMAGKAVKCPECGQSVRVPGGGAGQLAQAASATSSRMNDLFSEEGFSAHVAAVCPACRAEMPAGAVLCTKCGYHIETGTQFQSHKTAGVDIDHGTLALQKAAEDMVKDKEMQQKMLSGAGMPWWGLALTLFVIGSGLTIAVLAVNASRRVDESISFNPMGLFLLLSGIAFYLVAQGAFLMIVIHAFKNSVKQGLLTLLVPLYVLYYVIQNPRDTWKFLVGTIVIGGIAGGLFAAASSQGI